MKRYVALLRGINVGGNNKVPMSELRNLFETLGFLDVSTYINSGNVLFASKESDFSCLDLDERIGDHFGFVIPVLVVEAVLLEQVVEAVPKTWVNDATYKTDVLFLFPEFKSRDVLKQLGPTPVDDMVYVQGGAVVWRVKRSEQSKSRMQKGFIGSPVYKGMTARNINTVRKLAELVKT